MRRVRWGALVACRAEMAAHLHVQHGAETGHAPRPEVGSALEDGVVLTLDVWQSQAWDDWRTAVTPVWNSEIRSHMVHADGSPGVYQHIFPA